MDEIQSYLILILLSIIILSLFIVLRRRPSRLLTGGNPNTESGLISDNQPVADQLIEKEEQARTEPGSSANVLQQNVDRYSTLFNYFFKYIERNLEQDKGLYDLIFRVMLLGFVTIIIGILLSLSREGEDTSHIVIIAGILTEFIAGTVLIVYRLLNQRTIKYFSVLQDYVRLEAAFRIIQDFDDDDDTTLNELKILKINTKAEMAKMLINYVNTGISMPVLDGEEKS